MHLVESCDHIALQVGIHVNCRSCCGLRLGLAEMLFSEQELSVQVADLNYIRIGQDNLTSLLGAFDFLACTYAEHSVVLQQLAANSASANHEQSCVH